MLKSIKQQYIDLREGNMTQTNFMRNLRMTLPQYVTNLSSFEDSLRILKNKGILTEADMKIDNDDEKYNKEEAEEAERINMMIDQGLENQFDESYYADSDPTDGDYDFDVEQRMKAEEYYHKGEQAYLDGDLSKAETLYQAALKAGSYLSWTEFDLPRYDSTSINESISDDEIMKKYNEMFGKNPQTKFADVAKALNIPEDQVASALQSGAMPKFGLRENKDEKGKWTNTSGKSMYDQFKEIDNLNGQEVLIGIDYEMIKNKELTKVAAAKIVIKNLKKNPIYYTASLMAGKEGYEPEYIGGKSANAEARQMQPLDKNMGNVVDKKMGMQPVKDVEKPKKDSDKGGETNKMVKGVELMSLIAKTVRGMQKMDATGEKMKKISVKENKEESKSSVDYHNLKTSDQAARAKKIYDDEEKKRKEKNDSSLKNKLKELIRRELKEYEVGDESYKLNNLEAAQAVVDNLLPNLEGDTFTESELQDSFITIEDQMGQHFDDEVFDLAIELLEQEGYTIEVNETLGIYGGDGVTDVNGHQFD
jgi:hypothetical protein